MPELGQREQLTARPLAGVYCVAVDPVGGVGVAAHLHVLRELLVPDRAALLEQLLDLLEHERVALDRGRVMGFLEPDPAPDAVGFDGRRQAAESLAQLADLYAQALIDGCACGSPAIVGRDFVWLRHFLIVPNIF